MKPTPPKQDGPFRAPDNLPTLDGLRAVAVLMVLWFHIPHASLPAWSERLVRALRPGYFGVDIFFVLSGFLITRILLDYRRKGTSLRVFFARRFLRIFPAYYLLLAVVALTAPSWGVVWSAAYLANLYFPFSTEDSAVIHHLWSLSVEEHFYLVWPLIVCLLPQRLSRWLMLVGAPVLALTSAVVFCAVWDGKLADDMVWQNTLPRSLSLAAGGALALYEATLRGRAGRSLVGAVAAVLVGAATLLAGKSWAPGDAWLVARLVGGTIASTGLVLAAICLPPASVPARLLSAWPMRHIGQISYGLYLYHHPVYFLTIWSATPWLGIDHPAPALGLSYAVALASYHAWEKPFLRLKDRWRATPALPPAARAACDA